LAQTTWFLPSPEVHFQHSQQPIQLENWLSLNEGRIISHIASYSSQSRQGQGAITDFFDSVTPGHEADRAANATDDSSTNTHGTGSNSSATTMPPTNNSAVNSRSIGSIYGNISALSSTAFSTVSTAVTDYFNSRSQQRQGRITAFFNFVTPGAEANRAANATHNCTTNTEHTEATREATPTTTTTDSPTNAPLTCEPGGSADDGLCAHR
jgi:hypothetical protein